MPTFEAKATNLYGNSGAATVRVTYTQTKYSSYSIVEFTKLEVASHAASGYTFWPDGYIKVGGVTVCTCSQSAGIYIGETDRWYEVTADLGSATVNHAEDGTGSMKVTFHNKTSGWSGFFFANDSAGNLQFRVTNGTSVYVELDAIGLTSTLSCAGGTLGQEVTLNIVTESASSTHIINYSCGSKSGVAKLMTYERQIQWIPPIELAESEPSGTSVSVTFTLETYINGELIGTSTATAAFLIPDDILPTVTATIADAKGYADIYGGYIQNQSALSVAVDAEGSYGSTIRSRQISFDGKTYTAAKVTTEVIKGSGTLHLLVTVKDSRGREASTTLEVSVLPYEPPKIESLTVQRCDEDGTRNKSGAYLSATFNASVTPLGELNSASYKLQYKKSSVSYYTAVTLEALSGQYVVTGAEYRFEADPSFSYNVVITAEDDFGSIPKSANGPSKSVFWSRMAKGAGFAFGKICELKGHLDMGWHIFMNKNRVYGLPDPTADDEAVTLAYLNAQMDALTKTCNESIKTAKQESLEAMYPIGAPYISFTNATSPDKILGFGTWARVEGRFLLAAGSPDANTDNRFGAMSGTSWTVAAGSKGGQDYHSLTVPEMPSHCHEGVRRYNNDYPGSASTGASSGSDDSATHTDYEGGGEAHNNMPPYIAVYIWQRTA